MITYSDLCVDAELLKEIRYSIYHSKGNGYYICKNFIPRDYVVHMQKLWTNLEPYRYYKKYLGKDQFVAGCKNLASVDQEKNTTFHNFFWNPPIDELTHSVSMAIHMLRNSIEGNIPYRELLPFASRATNYRVVITKNHSAPVPPHKDLPPAMLKDHAGLLMCTLFLSKKGLDYKGEGFAFVTNQGKRLVFDEDECIEPGDLLIWSHQNEHSVMNIHSEPSQIGFVRMLFPREIIRKKKYFDKIKVANYKKMLGESYIGENLLLPIYRALRGR